jgi:hypothetical protein
MRILYLLFLQFSLFGSQIETFISSTENYIDSQNYRKQRELLSNFDSNLLKNIRLDLSLSDFYESQLKDEYELRVYPKWFSQSRTEDEIANIESEIVLVSKEERREDILYLFHSLLLEANFQWRRVQHFQNSLELHKKSLKALSQSVNYMENIVAIAKISYKIENLEVKLKREEKIFNRYIFEILSYFDGGDFKSLKGEIIELDFSNLKRKIGENSFTSLKRDTLELQKAQKELQLSEIESSFRFNSFNLKYENNLNKRDFAVGFSFEFPLGEDMSLLEKRVASLQRGSELSFNLREKMRKVKKLELEISVLEESLSESSVDDDKFYQKYKKINSPKPDVVFEIEAEYLKRDRDVLEIEYETSKKYLELIREKGNLSEETWR